MDLTNKHVIVAGLGISGNSMIQVLQSHGAQVTSVDERKDEADLHSFDDINFDDVDLVCTSPVFPPSSSFIHKAQARNIPVISEVELAWDLRVPNVHTGKPAPWIGITGTNGKTTTTQMTAAMLQGCGLQAPAVGNIGSPVSQAATDENNDVLCVELSSFQLHFTDSLALTCATITNIAADHLDWHGGMDGYVHDKSKVFAHAQRVIVYNADDEHVTTLAKQADTADDCVRIGCTLGVPQEGQLGIEDGWIVDRSMLTGEGTTRLAPMSKFTHLAQQDGSLYPHLVADALTSLALVLGLGCEASRAIEALAQFSPGGHRIEEVARLERENGTIRFVDDSKATNGHAAAASLRSFPKKSVIWIAGGLAKGSRFEDLVEQQAEHIKAAVIIGVDQAPMLEAFQAKAPHIPLTIIDPHDSEHIMQHAVEAAGSYAEPHDVILMAPACASMDQFVSYADRGNQFAKEAQAWVKSHV